jgi:hypothetical protein
MSLRIRLQDLITRIGTEYKAIYAFIRGSNAGLSALTTTNKSSLLDAINELKTDVTNAANSGGAAINDTGSSTSSVWSSQKTSTEIAGAVAGLVDSSPAALDTLNELAAALGDDASFASTTATALGNRLRIDAAQTLTAPQKAFGIANLGAISANDIGDPDVDLVAAFEASLA